MPTEPRDWCRIRAAEFDGALEVLECRFVASVPERRVVATGEATATWLDSEGVELDVHRLAATWTQSESGGSTATIDGVIPGHPDSAALRLTLAEATVSVPIAQEAPTLEVLDGIGGDADAVVRIAWATDVDPDRVALTIVSPDGRRTPAAADISHSAAELDLSGVSGHELTLELAITYQVRTTVETLGHFSRPELERMWGIAAPAVGSSIPAGQQVELWAVAPAIVGDETSLSDRTLIWRSSLDGVIGETDRGAALLSPGEHLVELLHGEAVMATTTVSVRHSDGP